MRKPRSLLRELAGRTSVARLAEKFNRSASTIRKWLTTGPPASAQATIAKAHVRSEKARAAAKKGWESRRLNEARATLGVGQSAGATRDYLLALIADDDPIWIAHKKAFEEAGLSEHEAHERWHYPKIPRSKKRKIRRKKRKSKNKSKGRRK